MDLGRVAALVGAREDHRADGLALRPPPGPATPVIDTAMSAPLFSNAPRAMLQATATDTAPNVSNMSPPTFSKLRLAWSE